MIPNPQYSKVSETKIVGYKESSIARKKLYSSLCVTLNLKKDDLDRILIYLSRAGILEFNNRSVRGIKRIKL